MACVRPDNCLGEPPVLSQTTLSSQIGAAAPYLTAALHILRTLEREIRAMASMPGSKEAIAAEALRTRGTELAAQIARLEMEARTARLEQQLAMTRKVQRQGGSTATQPDDGSASSVGAVVAMLRAKVAQAEKDAKAYKARMRGIETLERSKAELSDKVEALETEAKAEALKKELKRDIRDVAQERHSQTEVLRRVSELEGELQRALLERATMERRAEVCEAELVESLAKLYMLEREKQGGAAGGAARAGTSAVPLTDENLRLVDACLEEATRAVTESAVAPSKRGGAAPWRAKAWLDTLALGGLIADVILRQLRTRLDATEPLERAFLVAVKARGGRRLMRSLLLEADVVEQLSERLWMALQALPDANDGGGGGAPLAPQTLQYQGFEQWHMLPQHQQRF